MAAGGPKGSQIPLSPMRRCARSGWRAWWKVERGLVIGSFPIKEMKLLSFVIPLLISHGPNWDRLLRQWP
jgi:hypothetical protein